MYNQEAIMALFRREQSPPAPDVAEHQGQSFYPQTPDGALVQLPLERLTDFPIDRQPFRPATDQRIEELRQDVAQNGLISPLIVRPMTDGSYQILIGHNRRKAAALLGYETLPCIVRYLDDERALQILIADNLLHREKILPSEKAFAYKQRLDYLNRQGKRTDLTSGQAGQKLMRDELAENTSDSGRQIQRYIRLTHLIRPLLDKVDNQDLGLQTGATLSYLTPSSQRLVLRRCFSEGKGLSQRVAQKMRDLEEEGLLNEDTLEQLLNSAAQARAPRVIKLPAKALRDYFPAGTPADEIMEKILFALRTVYGDQG